jgi:hypothetical protein
LLQLGRIVRVSLSPARHVEALGEEVSQATPAGGTSWAGRTQDQPGWV